MKHPGHWESAIEAYRSDLGKTVIVTGGVSPTAFHFIPYVFDTQYGDDSVTRYNWMLSPKGRSRVWDNT